jgi:hypothetical protein
MKNALTFRVSPEGCRRLAGGNTPGHGAPLGFRPGRGDGFSGGPATKLTPTTKLTQKSDRSKTESDRFFHQAALRLIHRHIKFPLRKSGRHPRLLKASQAFPSLLKAKNKNPFFLPPPSRDTFLSQIKAYKAKLRYIKAFFKKYFMPLPPDLSRLGSGEKNLFRAAERRLRSNRASGHERVQPEPFLINFGRLWLAAPKHSRRWVVCGRLPVGNPNQGLQSQNKPKTNRFKPKICAYLCPSVARFGSLRKATEGGGGWRNTPLPCNR